MQEAGFVLTQPRIIGRVNPNSSFFAHAQYIVTGIVDKEIPSDPDEFEFISGYRFFSKEELRTLTAEGELQCGFTMAALWVSGI